MSKLTSGIPFTLTPEYVTRLVHTHGAVDKLNELADRGIILNTWQASQLFIGDNRGVGKTYLSFVRAAESLRNHGGTISSNSDLTKWDPDTTSNTMSKVWLREFREFIIEHYSDVFSILASSSNEVTLELKQPKTRRWWN